MRAITNGDYEAVQLLLEEGANPNIEGPYGLTPLHIAIRFNQTRTFRLLLTTWRSNVHAVTQVSSPPSIFILSWVRGNDFS